MAFAVAFGIAWDPYVARASSFVVVKRQRVHRLVSGLLAVVVLPWVGRRPFAPFSAVEGVALVGGFVEVGEHFREK